MAVRPPRSCDYELLPRTSSDTERSLVLGLDIQRRPSRLPSWLRCSQRPPSHGVRTHSAYPSVASPARQRRRLFRYTYYALAALPYFLVCLVLLTTAFWPSYTHRPEHYNELRKRCLNSSYTGRGNINNEKVFIAASIYDQGGTLAGGAWGDALLELVDLLGPDNVYLSIYENDPDSEARAALMALDSRLQCNSSIIAEHLRFDDVPRVILPTGDKRIKRIAYLAEVRNRALRPLDNNLGAAFDRLLYVNDVVFDPVEAVQLLFATNVDESGRAQYGAACAVDFINPFKFYDRFATRDLEGYSMGIPFYPWFTNAGSSISRQDVLGQKDAVRVRSCWGGMTAFEAKWFQPNVSTSKGVSSPRSETDSASDHANTDENGTLGMSRNGPIRFRAENDTFWDSSECCLIHADLQYLRSGHNISGDAGIYMNPYIRVAYDEYTLSWLSFTRRPERLYSLVHNILNHLAGMPLFNPRRTAEPGDEIIEKVWSYDDPKDISNLRGSFEDVKRIVGPGGFCGGRKLLLLNEHPEEGELKWINWPIPPTG